MLTGKDGFMSRPRKYDRELQDRAVRLYKERLAGGGCPCVVCQAVRAVLVLGGS